MRHRKHQRRKRRTPQEMAVVKARQTVNETAAGIAASIPGSDDKRAYQALHQRAVESLRKAQVALG